MIQDIITQAIPDLQFKLWTLLLIACASSILGVLSAVPSNFDVREDIDIARRWLAIFLPLAIVLIIVLSFIKWDILTAMFGFVVALHATIISRTLVKRIGKHLIPD